MTPIVAPQPARRWPALVSATGYGLGIPALLVRAAGWPLPRRLPTPSSVAAAFGGQWRPDDHFVISALAVIAWAVWAQIGAVTLSELRTIRSGRPGRTVPWSAWCRPMALRLATTLAVLVPLAPRAAGATPLTISRTAVQAVATSSAPAPSARPAGIEPSVTPVQMARVVHIVRPDETLWDIARTQLGDPRRWRELFDLNRDRPQPDGRRLEDQDLLRPGWRIELPVSVATMGATAQVDPGPTPPPIACPTAQAPLRAAASTPPPTLPQASAGPHRAELPTAAPATPGPPSPATHHNAPHPEQDTPPVPIIGVAAVTRIGLPALTGGVLLGYLGGLRRDRERRRRRHHRFPAPTQAQQTAERSVRAIARTDAPTWVDLALRHLAASMAEKGAPPPPTVRAVLAGDAGVEILVSPAWPVAPGRFLPQDDGQIWRLDPTVDLDALRGLVAGAPAYVPGVVTVGELDGDAVLIDLADAASLLVEGDPTRTNAIATAMAAELATAPWSQTCDVCLVGVAEDLEPLERVQVLPADGAVAELVSRAHSQHQSGLAEAAHGDIPAALTIAVVGAGALPADELAALVAAARPHTGLAVIAATPAGGVAGRFRLVCEPDDSALLYPLGLTVTPAQPHATSQRFVDVLTATATAGDIPLNADGSAPPTVETAEEPATDHNEEGDTPEFEALVDADTPGDDRPGTNGSTPTAVESAEVPASDDTDDSQPPVAEAYADAEVGHDAPPAAESAPAVVEPTEETDTATPVYDAVADAARRPTGMDTTAAEPAVDVRLLGPIEITWQHKTPKRQVGELVSYLAVHPRGVSTDEARLALWPTTVDDDHFGERAQSTFWALTTKARSALGDDRQGNALLIREANNGWRLSPGVRCDWLEFQRLVAEARRDPAQAAASLKGALGLVRGRPFQGSVFSWVEVERLDGVMEAVIGDAAATLAELALASGDRATARFAVHQGLLGVPHAEGLVRWAMRIAAAGGDRAGIERAWRDARRIATELDPLGVPEAETAELYESLRRKDPS